MKIPSLGVSPAVKHVTRGTLYAVIATLVMVLIFAFVIKIASLSSDIIKPVVQIIKVLSIFYGVLITLKHIDKQGWLFGAIVGLLYTVLAFFIFSILDNNFGITTGLLTDMLFACIIGAISAFLLRTMRASAV